ncbi:MAG TPA: mannosyltransferase family protein [Ktedonobacterales bacterium]|nr:mannosyltransferase family protein [Ktedonobacterales bacterium]
MQQISDSEFAPEAIELPPTPYPARRRLDWLRHPSPALRQAILLFCATRLLFVLVTYFGYVLFNAGIYSPDSVGVNNVLFSWARWDAVRYLNIALNGYNAPILAAFFPLYPLLVHIAGQPFGDAGVYIAGLLISNIAFFFALWALRVLAERECGPEAASRATIYLALFPTALFFFAPYNESLFLLLALGCFLALRRGWWWRAGVLGLLATLTRSAGLFLVAPFMVEYLNQHRWQWRRLRPNALAVGLVPLGLVIYGGYCWLQFGDFLAFVHAQAHWGRALAWPWVGLWNQQAFLIDAQPASFFQAHNLIDLAATVAMIVLVVLGWRHLPLSFNMFATVLLVNFLLFPLAFNDPLTSNQRFALEVFPAFLTLGLLVRRQTTHQALMILFSGLLALFSLVFITGRWLV